jgi:hypothetical protein
MTRNLKALLVSAMAVLAIGAVGAQAAQGALFHSEISNPTLTPQTDGALNSKTAHQVLDFAGAAVTFAGIAGDGAFGEGLTSTTMTLDIAFDSPGTFVGQSATINMNGCDITVTSHGTLSLTNRTGKNCATEPITFSVPSPPCTVTLGSAGGVNQNLESVSFHNLSVGSARVITMEANVTGIHYVAHGSGCPLTGTRTDGTYTTGNSTITGENPINGAMVGVWWE